MSISCKRSNALSAGGAKPGSSKSYSTSTRSRDPSSASLSQVDGAADYQLNASRRSNYVHPTRTPALPRYLDQRQGRYQHQAHHVTSHQAPPQPKPLTSTNIVSDLLPYCTTEPPLSQEQVIALTDVVGNLKELVLLALGAASGDVGCVERLEGAVGSQAAASIAEFFVDEWEIEG
ncbi:Nn.00g058130.m01.CDS01 [Neocucurbitaria sp. VM-36]